jgi:hypothetical protein
VVRWSDSGHEAILYPGSDAYVQHFEPRPAASSSWTAGTRSVPQRRVSLFGGPRSHHADR